MSIYKMIDVKNTVIKYIKRSKVAVEYMQNYTFYKVDNFLKSLILRVHRYEIKTHPYTVEVDEKYPLIGRYISFNENLSLEEKEFYDNDILVLSIYYIEDPSRMVNSCSPEWLKKQEENYYKSDVNYSAVSINKKITDIFSNMYVYTETAYDTYVFCFKNKNDLSKFKMLFLN